MENHHCALTFALLEQPENAVLAALDKAQRKVRDLLQPGAEPALASSHTKATISEQEHRRLLQTCLPQHCLMLLTDLKSCLS